MYEEQGEVIVLGDTPEQVFEVLSNLQIDEVTETHAFMFNCD